MTTIDITMPVSPATPMWPGSEPPRQQWASRIADGQPADESAWRVGSHTGTHVDAPSHFVAGGATTEMMSLDRLVGPCSVIAVDDHDGLVGAEHLLAAWPDSSAPSRRLLLKTRNSNQRRTAFDPRFVSLGPSAAELLVEREVLTVGVDGFSVERLVDLEQEPGYAFPVHGTLLGAGVAVIENLELGHVATGGYQLCCLPMKLVGSEAAPARAVLQELA